jgi:hypothetical protein
VQVKTNKDHQLPADSEYVTLQIGAGLARWKNLKRAELGMQVGVSSVVA